MNNWIKNKIIKNRGAYMRGSMKMLRYKPPMLHTMSIVAERNLVAYD